MNEQAESIGLFSPLRIGSLTVRNRILSTAHLTNFAADGIPSARHREYWREKARGGIGLMITEGSLVHPSSRTAQHKFIELWKDEIIQPFRAIAEEVRQEGARLIAQLNHMGLEWSPSPWPRPNGQRAHEMTHQEIDEVVTAFAAAAGRVQRAGLDGVEVHASHGYLIEQFLSPLKNYRTDSYGGSESNRMRLLVRVLEEVRREVGDAFVVGIRVSGDEFKEGGNRLEDMKRVVGEITDRVQVDFVNVSYYQNQDYGPASTSIVPMYVPEGRFVYLAEEIRKAISVPVFCVNRIVDPRMAERIIAENRVDMVGMTRANIADPHLSQKAAEGRSDEIRPCIGINEGCMGQVMSGAGSPLTCAVNPSAGRENESVLEAAQPRHIAVVGGGIAGMEVARVAAERGHSVTLLERDDMLGGQLVKASRVPHLDNMARPVSYYERQFELLGVDVACGTGVDKRVIDAVGADSVVVATGSRGATWAEGGLGPAPVFPTVTAREALELSCPGERVLVYATDQSLEPLGVADHLAQTGAFVTFATPSPNLGALVESQTLPFLLHSLRQKAVTFYVMAQLSVNRDGTSSLTLGGEGDAELDVDEQFDRLVLGLGSVAVDSVYRALSGVSKNLHVVGDAYAPRRLVAATQQAYSVARAL